MTGCKDNKKKENLQFFLYFCKKKRTFAPSIWKPMNKFEKSLRFISEKILPDSPFYGKIFLVGGCVRDELLGERYSDLDLLINLPNGQKEFVEWMCATYPKTCKGPFYYQRYGTTAMDLIIDKTTTLVECVEPHVEAYADDGVTLLETRFCTLEEDALRRDYTCNALYKNLSTGEILDPTGKGIEDLRNKLLRTPAEPNQTFRQDPVRMLRGIRFKHQKGFQLDDAAWKAILQQHDEMRVSAPKRLRDELNKMLKARTFGEGINDLYVSGLLPYIMPGLADYLGADIQHPYCEPGISVWKHTRTALSVLCREHPHTDGLVKLTALLLDVADVAGTEKATEILVGAQVGKERVTSIIHNIKMYQRFRSFYDNRIYIGRPRALPHFIIAISAHKDEFRRMVRAENHLLIPNFQLPYQVFYDKDYNAADHGKRKRRQEPEKVTDDTRTPEQIKQERNHRRNVKRRLQRKRRKQDQITSNKSEGIQPTLPSDSSISDQPERS